MEKLHINGNGLASLKEDGSALIQSIRNNVTWPVITRAATLGFVGGLRSMAPFALLGWTRKRNPSPTNEFEQLLDSPLAPMITSTLASGELVGDKLPNVPDRIQPLPFLGRLTLGGLAGVSIFRRYQQPLIVGAAMGVIGAGAGAYAGYYGRRAIAHATKTPPWLLGLVEDGLAYGLGFLAVKKSKS